MKLFFLGRIAWVMAAALVVSGCATAYRNDATSLTGGGAKTKGPGRLVRVVFYGNGLTPSFTIARYAVFRAAEYAHAKGKPYFVLYPTITEAAMDRPANGPAVMNLGGKTMATTYVLALDKAAPGALETAELLAQLAAEQGEQATTDDSANGKDWR
jgi:hypothetical protein